MDCLKVAVLPMPLHFLHEPSGKQLLNRIVSSSQAGVPVDYHGMGYNKKRSGNTEIRGAWTKVMGT